MKEKGEKISNPKYSIFPAVLSLEKVSAELTASLGGELGNSAMAQRAAGGKGQRDLGKQPQNNLLFI